MISENFDGNEKWLGWLSWAEVFKGHKTHIKTFHCVVFSKRFAVDERVCFSDVKVNSG